MIFSESKKVYFTLGDETFYLENSPANSVQHFMCVYDKAYYI